MRLYLLKRVLYSLLVMWGVATLVFFPQLYRELGRISKDAVEYANSLTPDRIRDAFGVDPALVRLPA